MNNVFYLKDYQYKYYQLYGTGLGGGKICKSRKSLEGVRKYLLPWFTEDLRVIPLISVTTDGGTFRPEEYYSDDEVALV